MSYEHRLVEVANGSGEFYDKIGRDADATIATLQAQVAQLRAALEEIAGCRGNFGSGIKLKERARVALDAKAGASMSKASDDVLAERERQKNVEGWTTEHDDAHKGGEMSDAAASYASYGYSSSPPTLWPWDNKWWKPKSHRRNCVKAAALLIAEIERLDRLEKATNANR